MNFKEYLEEAAVIDKAAKEIFADLFSGSFGKSTDPENYFGTVLKKYGLAAKDRTAIVTAVKKLGYTGSLLG